MSGPVGVVADRAEHTGDDDDARWKRHAASTLVGYPAVAPARGRGMSGDQVEKFVGQGGPQG